jgi:uncharacterized protein with HEPN domain
MSPEDLARMRHMLESAREANELIKDKKREDLDIDRLLNLALVRLLEVVGEAANRVTNTTRLQFSEIPWAQIISLRNRLIHGYDSVDMDVLWEILTDDLSALIARLEAIREIKDESSAT